MAILPKTSVAESCVFDGDSTAIVLPSFVAPKRWARIRNWTTTGRSSVAIRGGVWTITGYILTQILRVSATLVLARHFLGPESFGIVGLVSVFVAGLSMFSELGIVANVVQHVHGDDPDFLNTAFSVQALRGLGIWVAAVAAAYPMAHFYNQPALLPLLAVAGLAELIRGLTSTAAWTFTRHVNLRNVSVLMIASESAAFAVGLLWAVVSPSPWALVARTIAGAAAYTIISHFIAKPAVRFGWVQSYARDILHFGGWVSIATATYFLGGQGERLILGKFITAAELGCFSLALMVAAAPAVGVSTLVSQIFLPMISASVRAGHVQTVRDFIRSRRLFFVVGLFAAFGFLALSRPFVALVLPSKYAMAGWMLQLLGLRVALDIFAAPASSLVLAYGRSNYSALANTTRLVLMIGGIWVGFAYSDIHMAIVALIFAQAFSYFPLISGIKRLLPEVWRMELRWYCSFLAIVGAGAMLPWPGR